MSVYFVTCEVINKGHKIKISISLTSHLVSALEPGAGEILRVLPVSLHHLGNADISVSFSRDFMAALWAGGSELTCVCTLVCAHGGGAPPRAKPRARRRVKGDISVASLG